MARAAHKDTATLPLLVEPVKGQIHVGDVPSTPKGRGRVLATVTSRGPPKQIAPAKDVAEPKNMLAVIAQAAANPNCNPESMRALLDMQREIAAEEARIVFIQDFALLQSDLSAVKIRPDGKITIPAKEGTNRRAQETPYASLPNILKVVKPLLQTHHFTLSHTTEPSLDGTRLLVKGHLAHVRGHERVTVFPLPAETSGSKNNVQAWGSSQSYGRRYTTIALLNIISDAAEDKDDDGMGGDSWAITDQQVKQLDKAMRDEGMIPLKFMETYQIERMIDLPAAKFAEAMQRIRQFGVNKRNQARG